MKPAIVRASGPKSERWMWVNGNILRCTSRRLTSRQQLELWFSGALMAASQGYASAADPYRSMANDTRDLTNAMRLGAAFGIRAYSQTYELESDVIATHISCAAGFDSVKGARYFARPEKPQGQLGQLSFWGTHPANDTRLALVIETNAGIDQNHGLQRAQ